MSPPTPFFEEQPDPIASRPRDGGVTEVSGLPPDRPNYDTGVLLDAEDFRAEQLYHRARLADALLYLGGSGTLAGLRVNWLPPAAGVAPGAAQDGQLQVEPGVALDRFGRLIEVPRPTCLRLRPWLMALETPVLHGAPHDGLVADVFIRFLAAPRGYTPAYASGPYDATNAVTPARIRDSFRLDLVPRQELGQLEQKLPQDSWPDLTPIADATDRQRALREAILAAWRGGSGESDAQPWDPDGRLRPLPEHARGQDATALFLARVTIPAVLDESSRVNRQGDVRVENTLRSFVYSTAALAAWAGLAGEST